MFFRKIQEEQPDIITVIMTQLSLKAGLRKWGTKAHNAVHYEIMRLHLRKTFKPMHWKELDDIQSNSVLLYHMLLKQNRDVKIKRQKMAGGNKQIYRISKEDSI